MNSENSKISYSHRLILKLADKINLKLSDKFVALSNLSIYYTWKNTKEIIQKKNKFKVLALAWNNKLELPDGSYSVSDIQYHFEYVIKKHETVHDNLLIRIYVNKRKNKLTFEIKTGFISNF